MCFVIRSMTIVIKLMTDYVHARRKLPARGVKMAAEALHTPSLRKGTIYEAWASK